jgi:hypothetical protein
MPTPNLELMLDELTLADRKLYLYISYARVIHSRPSKCSAKLDLAHPGIVRGMAYR